MSEFQIENGVLIKFQGDDRQVVIPEGVTAIGPAAFRECKELTEVQIPDSVTSIGEYAFYACKSLTSVQIPKNVTAIEKRTFGLCSNLKQVMLPDALTTIGNYAFGKCSALEAISIPASVTQISYEAFRECESLTSVVIPEGVTAIEQSAFNRCKKLTSVIIPDSLTSIGYDAFGDCPALTEFKGGSAKLKIEDGAFGLYFPMGLMPQLGDLICKMSNYDVVYLMIEKRYFEKLNAEAQVTVMLAKQGKKLLNSYPHMNMDPEQVSNIIASRIHDKYSPKECTAVAALMVSLWEKFTGEQLQAIYARLKPLKKAAKALETIQSCTGLMKKLGMDIKTDDALTGLARKVADWLWAQSKLPKDAETDLTEFYGIATERLPVLKDTAGADVDPLVFTWMLTAHEQLFKGTGAPEVYPNRDQPGIRPEADEILAELDHGVLMDALLQLADKYLGMSGRTKQMFLAYPICRYADESLMQQLTKRAPGWSSYVSGDDAPALRTFRMANRYSNTLAAMIFADAYQELDEYAKLRNTDADTLRDQALSDVGLDIDGGKAYDLGNQVVIARLQEDRTFLFELPTGKTMKTLPKKGADVEKHAAANADFAELKKNVRKVLKNRNTILWKDFLSGKIRSKELWKSAYLNNALLRNVARLLVWEQNGQFFTVSNRETIAVDGSVQPLTDQPVRLAHPMDMDTAQRQAWQQYFAAHGLKQPFEQVWEPVIDPDTIHRDRYKGCMIPYYRFHNAKKHGIHVCDEALHSEITITFDDCNAYVDRIDQSGWGELPMNERFEVVSFEFSAYNRRVNHIATYLDKITIIGRIIKDDVSVADRLAHFTFAQIMDFIRIAQENNAVNVTALLLEYRNKTFASFDPMDEFTLEL